MSVLFVKVREGQVKRRLNGIICGAAWAVGKLEQVQVLPGPQCLGISLSKHLVTVGMTAMGRESSRQDTVDFFGAGMILVGEACWYHS